MLIDKYNRIILENLPTEIQNDVNEYYSDTVGFTDDDANEICETGFNELFKIIESKYPDAIKPKLKLKSVKDKIIVKKSEKPKLTIKKKPKFKKGVRVQHIYSGPDTTQFYYTVESSEFINGQFIYKLIGQKKEIELDLPESKLKIAPKQKLIKKSLGRGFSGYQKGERLTKENIGNFKKGDILLTESYADENGDKIKNVLIIKSDPVEAETAVNELGYLITVNWLEEPKEKKDFSFYEPELLAGNFFLPQNKESDCEQAIEQLAEIENKKNEAAKKRSEAPKKKVSTSAKEKQLKTISIVFKTKHFKDNKNIANEFSNDLIAVYKKHGLGNIAEQLKKGIDEQIKNKYK